MRYTVIVENDQIFWYKEGTSILHREDGPAVEYTSGDKCWYHNGKCHRLDGPAVEFADGSKVWYQNDKRHREAGPAIEYSDGSKYWYLDGKEYSEAEFLKKTKPAACDGQVVDIGGIKYQLKAV